MVRSIRKSTTHLGLTYSNGNYTNNLFCKNIEIDTTTKTNKVILNLEGNLRVQNKEVNSYADAKELIEEHRDLSLIQISEDQVTQALIAAEKKNPSYPWQLEITLGAQITYLYNLDDLKLKRDPITIDFKVSNVLIS